MFPHLFLDILTPYQSSTGLPVGIYVYKKGGLEWQSFEPVKWKPALPVRKATARNLTSRNPLTHSSPLLDSLVIVWSTSGNHWSWDMSVRSVDLLKSICVSVKISCFKVL
jgi:hypothetical protein